MTDYDLTRLSPRSFEQLCQAIAAKVIGPDIVVFGDGPDGGREATFEGRIPYPSERESWHGYGVIQAKFRQRPRGSKVDGDWAIKQLRSELEKFADPERKLRKPDYYIFATNVVLTPVHDKGSKDKINALVKEFSEPIPLKSYDIWDYDKIRSFLDGLEEIRRTYAAWITPGDVLHEVIKWMTKHSPDFEETMVNFLQKKLLDDQFVNLEQAGYTGDEKIPLASVFIDLPAFDEPHPDPPDEASSENGLPSGFVSELIQIGSDRVGAPPSSTTILEQSSGADGATPGPGRYVLIGGPGQGKTTVTQFACQLYRAAILKSRSGDSFSPEVEKALGILDHQCETEHINMPTVPRFPIQVVLSSLASSLASEDATKPNSLLSYIAHLIGTRANRDISASDLRDWLKVYPWVIFLDGLDEVPASSNREDVLAAIREFWIDVAQISADVVVIATTRPQGYNEEFSNEFYRQKWLAPLSPVRSMHYGNRLTDVRYGIDSQRGRTVISRIQGALEVDATARLMTSPLQVTIMATLVDRMGQAPQERWKLFSEYYKVIVQREMERPIHAARILREYGTDINAIHHRVGLALQVESDRSGGTEALLTAKRFGELVEARLVEEGHKGKPLADLRNEIIEAATLRLGFLVGLEAGKVGFEIRSLQEFMAAEALMEGGDEIVQARLREIAPLTSWRNVFLFAAGKSFTERQHLRDTIQTICAELNDDPETTEHRATLAGSKLSLDLLEDGPARRQPKYEQSLGRLALRLLELPPSWSHVRLADLYVPEFEHMFQKELTSRLQLSDPYSQLGAWATLTPLLMKKIPWAQKLAKSQWPKGEDRKLLLAEVAVSHRDGPAVLARLIDTLPRLRLLSSGFAPDLFDELRATLGEKAPQWLGSLARLRDFSSRERPSLEFHGVGGDNDGIKLNMRLMRLLSTTDSSWLYPMAEIRNPGPQIAPLVAAARFLQDPSRKSLSKQLRNLAEVFQPAEAIYSTDWTPWPLMACILAAAGSGDLLELSKLASKGDLGDTDEWLAADERWLEHGLREDDIHHMSDDRWPFDKTIAQIGFPGPLVNLIATLGADQSVRIRVLRDLHADLPQSKMRQKIASDILFNLAIASVNERWTASRELLIATREDLVAMFSVERLRDIIHDAVGSSQRVFIDSLVPVLRHETKLGADWIELIDFLGNSGDLSSIRGIGPGIAMPVRELLSVAIAESPTRVGLWKVFARSLDGPIPSLIPRHLVDSVFLGERKLRYDATLIKLAQGDISDGEIEQLANAAVEKIQDDPNAIDSFMAIVQDVRSQITTIHRAEWLRTVLDGLPNSNWQAKDSIIKAIDETLDKRTSGLNDPTTWKKLELPEGMLGLVPR